MQVVRGLVQINLCILTPDSSTSDSYNEYSSIGDVNGGSDNIENLMTN